MNASRVKALLANARKSLLSARNSKGHWEGGLSSSALSTATAIVALHTMDERANEALIEKGKAWLVEHQNEDGGWGDTVISKSNISTTLLCWSALKLLGEANEESVKRGKVWIQRYVGSDNPDEIAGKVIARYGKDRTFAVPILMMCAICGTLGNKKEAWKRVLPLPFELAVFPRKLFALLRLPVVSYALPALIAIGLARSRNAPPLFPFRLIRKLAWKRASGLLTRIQPTSGGFLEATPLTSFVVMALASSGETAHPVAIKGTQFIRESTRADGSWPIDTNLATWCTTLATKALAQTGDEGTEDFTAESRIEIRDWILGQQYRVIHPYTNAAPGGWAWTDLSGGVPDADDAAGALLALHTLGCSDQDAIEAGLNWLLNLQNGDGGMPTFCKGWGSFPFDRSSPDITAHALRAFSVWREYVEERLQRRIDRAVTRAIGFLSDAQMPNGAWNPLWFGNQHGKDECNPVYGTSMALLALERYVDFPTALEMTEKGQEWLASQQNDDGGWGGEKGCPSSLEETGLALDALALSADLDSLEWAVAFIERYSDGGKRFPVAPIGFYFAKLWYYEELYPNIWVVSALNRVTERHALWPSNSSPMSD